MQPEDKKYFQGTLTCWLEDLLKQGNNTITDLLDSTIRRLILWIRHPSKQIEISGFEYETGRAGLSVKSNNLSEELKKVPLVYAKHAVKRSL